MNSREIRAMSEEDILNAIEDKKEEIFNLRFQAASGQLEDTNALKYARRDIARLKTILAERQRPTQNSEGN
jgi:large subunit ribosomal protein L29